MNDEAIQTLVDDIPPVTHRHAKCKECEAEFTYWRGATNDNSGKRPQCPECGKQGIGGPFGRTSPAEYLGIITVAAANTEFDYRDWLIGDVVAYVEYTNGAEWIHIIRRDYLPCAIAYAASYRDEEGREEKYSRRRAWSPVVYWDYVKNGVEFELVPIEEIPEQAQEEIR